MIASSHKDETLCLWGTSCFDSECKEIGDRKINPVYIGEVENRVTNGQGIFTTTKGDKYLGEWKDGNRNGQGTFTFPNGSNFVEEYKDGLPNCQGSYTFVKG